MAEACLSMPVLHMALRARGTLMTWADAQTLKRLMMTTINLLNVVNYQEYQEQSTTASLGCEVLRRTDAVQHLWRNPCAMEVI